MIRNLITIAVEDTLTSRMVMAFLHKHLPGHRLLGLSVLLSKEVQEAQVKEALEQVEGNLVVLYKVKSNTAREAWSPFLVENSGTLASIKKDNSIHVDVDALGVEGAWGSYINTLAAGAVI